MKKYMAILPWISSTDCLLFLPGATTSFSFAFFFLFPQGWGECKATTTLQDIFRHLVIHHSLYSPLWIALSLSLSVLRLYTSVHFFCMSFPQCFPTVFQQVFHRVTLSCMWIHVSDLLTCIFSMSFLPTTSIFICLLERLTILWVECGLVCTEPEAIASVHPSSGWQKKTNQFSQGRTQTLNHL